MDISINDKPADIALDTEKTLGDVLSGIEQWISPSGNRIQGISVNGKAVGNDALVNAFRRDIREVKKLDISVCSWRELAAEALGTLLAVCNFYVESDFDKRREISSAWENNAAARFLKTDISDIYAHADKSFSGAGLSIQDLVTLIDERLREIADPNAEINGSEALVLAVAKRMEDIPLDIQTGKDQHAAETIQLFSGITEKLFRIFFFFKSEGLSPDTFLVDKIPVRTFMDEFGAVLKELSAAYENRDMVLVGDLAEYELSPRLLQFFTALKDFSSTPAVPSS